jgi:hypothetical protein
MGKKKKKKKKNSLIACSDVMKANSVHPSSHSNFQQEQHILHWDLNVRESSGPLHTRDWEPVTIALQALSLVEKAEPVQVRVTLRLRDQWSMWMQVGCKVHMDSYMASNGLCFMVTWIIFKNHLLEVGITQNQETMALWMLTTIDLLYFIMCEDPHE